MEFTELEKTKTCHKYVLESNLETMKMFPFKFDLYVTYEVEENRVITIYEVINKDEKEMLFGIGGHPAYICDYSSGNYSIEFNNGNEKSFVIKEGNTESLKAVIEESNGTTTINLSSDNTSIGTVSINDNNISLSIGDASTGVLVNANLTSSTENNIITTTFNMAISSYGSNIDVLTIIDTKTVTDGVADFSNINPTNNIDINSLTETDITTIQTNLMTILYNFMGIAM